jgi:lipopolysaccharide export system permease protein
MVFTFDDSGAFTQQMQAARATLHDGYWELQDK